MKLKTLVLITLIACALAAFTVPTFASPQVHAAEMQQNATEKRLTKKQEQAAVLVFDDQLADEAIAEKLGINRTTLHRWKQLPAFAARVDELAQKAREAIAAKGIALKEN